MFKNYLKIVLRNLLNDKFYTTITLLGLAIGMTASMFILHHVSYELSYDKFHEKADRIYRIEHQYAEQGEIRSRIKGRNFNVNRPADKSAVILSAKACRLLGFSNPEEAMNREILLPGPPNEPAEVRKVIGITKDYHQNSILSDVIPIIMTLNRQSNRYFSFKVNTKNLAGTIAIIQATWEKAFTGNIMSYFFLDDAFNQQYASELRFERIFRIFSSLAIFIACMGLLGLSAFTANQKGSEIGIRKIVGASVKDILVLLSKTYIKLLLISSLIAIPAIYFIFSNWLNNFSYRIDMEWWLVVGPGLIVFLIAIITTSFYTVKAALINPIQFLRSE